MIIEQILPIEKMSLCQMLFYNKGNYCYEKKGIKGFKGKEKHIQKEGYCLNPENEDSFQNRIYLETLFSDMSQKSLLRPGDTSFKSLYRMIYLVS